jgi:hypothetical protein
LVADQSGTATLTLRLINGVLAVQMNLKTSSEKVLLYMQQLMISILSLQEMQAEEWDV